MLKIRLIYSSTIALTAAFLLASLAPLEGAEMRTWTASSGGYKVEAELIAIKPGDIAQLKTKDGRTIEVPLAQLTPADQEFARKQQAPSSPTSATTAPNATSGTGSARLAEVQRAADRCRKPEEALILFKVFHDDAATSAGDREIALARIAEYKQLAAEKKVRLNKKWVAAEEANAVRKKADELIRQGLELLKLGQEDGGKKKFTEAANLEPESIRAEFILAFVYTMARSAEKALPLFQRCLTRDPDNIAVLNNIAMLSASRGDWVTMLTYWRRALVTQPDQRVIHNVGRFLRQSLEANLPIPKGPREALANPYTELVASGKFEATDPTVGWLFLLIEESDLDFTFKEDGSQATEQKSVAPDANGDGAVVSGGTGFVVHPGYVMTNAHVAEDDAVFEIQTADGKNLRATRVSKSDKVDLALLKCEELASPPLTLATDISPRGTDIMLLGYPAMFTLGATLKATRGSISSVPDPKFDDSYLYDAVSNGGNSGGPVCDATGTVIAVHYAGTKTTTRYASGIPAAEARAFLAQALPEAQTTVPNKEKLDWPTVDAKVSPSTVLIWVRKTQTTPTKPQIGSDVVELPICLFCGGKKGLRCVQPGCAKARAAGRGRDCPACRGSGLVKCEVCDGLGIDNRLASVQETIRDAIAAKTGSSNPTTPSPRTSTASASPDDITPDRLRQYRGEAKAGVPDSLKDHIVDTKYNYNGSLVQPQTNRLTQSDLEQISVVLRSRQNKDVDDAAVKLTASIVVPEARQQIAMLLEPWIGDNLDQWWTRAQVCRALGVWGREESKPMIHKLLRDRSWVTRRQAAITCGHTGDVSAVPALVDCLIRPEAFEGNHNPGQYDIHHERGRFLRAIIVIGPRARPELERVRPKQNVKVQQMIDFILAAIDEK